MAYHMVMARAQTLVQLSDELLLELDARKGDRSRSEVIREAIDLWLHQERELAIDAQIVQAYTDQPPEEFGADHAARAVIAAEPWEDARRTPGGAEA